MKPPKENRIDRETLRTRALELGFCRVRFLDRLPEGLGDLPPVLGDDSRNTSIMIAALAYPAGERDPSPSAPTPAGAAAAGWVAPFARRHYYRDAVTLLKGLAAQLREELGLLKRDIRIFSNSRLPEKLLAAASGIGFAGRNSLIITPETGSLVVLAGMALPFAIPSDPPLEGALPPGKRCGSCRRCISACPTQALDGKGNLDMNRCMQSRSTDPGPLPEELMKVWGRRIYGCQICQEVCPFNHTGIPPETGDLPFESIDLEPLLRGGSAETAELLRGSAMGLSWIPGEALQRNALLAWAHLETGPEKERLRPLVKEFTSEPGEGLRRAAEWALSFAPASSHQ
ncbi:MAG: hypothetical protein K9L68_07675 [Spirochaetales bacterium]|nr:hypothetical protein [Spirochaetales bacterium]MCF7938461.1 hypothetical protein [Spirochaetales bacterium]